MKAVRVEYKIKCDIGGCKKDAEIRLQADETGAHTGFYLCRRCAHEIVRALADKKKHK